MAKGDESVQISTGNPFGVLAKKKFKGDPNKFTSSDSKPSKKEDGVVAPKQVVDKGPAKESRQLRLTESEKPTKEVTQDPPAETKKDREAKDKHVDRSGKRDQTRKQGQGKGGWDDHTTTDVEKAAGEEKEEKEGEAPADENAPAKKEEKPEEEEAPTTTYEDYLKAQAEKKLNLAEFKIRQVDESQFKQMTVREGKPETGFMSVKIEKPAPKAAPAPAAKGAKNAKAAPAKPAPKQQEAPKKKEVTATKVELSELGFRMAAPKDTGRGGGRGGRGGGRGRGRGEGDAAGAAERPAGRGRGGYQGGRGRGGDRPAGGNFQMNENDFPVLGNKKEEATPASE